MVSKHYKNNLSCEIFTFMDSQKSSGPARIHLDFILSGGGWPNDGHNTKPATSEHVIWVVPSIIVPPQ